jgi:hypothetical protein
MKAALAALSALVLSSLAAVASADSACGPVLATCAPLLDAGACSPEAGAEHRSCGGGQGTCEVVPNSCEGAGESRCVGPRESTYPTTCGDEGGCSIATQPSRAMQRAALPSFFITVGLAAMVLERRRRHARGR